MDNGRKMRYTYRYTWRSWIDIAVDAGSREEADGLAAARYDWGDYDIDSVEDETTGVELIKVKDTDGHHG